MSRIELVVARRSACTTGIQVYSQISDSRGAEFAPKPGAYRTLIALYQTLDDTNGGRKMFHLFNKESIEALLVD